MIKRAMAGVLGALMAMTLVACGGGGVEGDWVIDKTKFKDAMKSMIEEGIKQAKEMGMPEETLNERRTAALKEIDEQVDKIDAVITFKSDGTVSAKGTIGEEDMSGKGLDGKWSQDGSTITITSGEGDDKQEAKGEMRDGRIYLKLDQPGMPDDFELVLKRK